MPSLHHHPLSAASRFVRLVFGEYGETLDLVEESPWQRDEALLALDPAGTLPLLIEDDGAVIAGAAVIAEYVIETRRARAGEDTLLPSDPHQRAETRRLVNWFGAKMNSEVTSLLVTEKVAKRILPVSEGGGSPDSAAIRAARANIRTHIRYIGYLADRRNWLAGKDLTLADLAAAAEFSCVDYLGEVPWEEDQRARTWYARIKSRPSFRPLLADFVRGAPPTKHYADLDF
ncbi:MAG: glutathione S-transferase family protein [Bauldia sp.]